MDGRPNILFLICHDLGRHLGCYGRGIDTPNLNRLAAEGVRFTEYFCTAPQCSPSRASIMTGQYPHTNGVMGLQGKGWQLRDDAVTLPKALAAAGYETHLFGFQHEHPDSFALGYQYEAEGFHRGQGASYEARRVAPKLCAFLREKREKPFFVSAGVFEPHIPYIKGPTPLSAWRRVEPLPFLPDHPAVRQDTAELHQSVVELDRHMGTILDTLDETGLAESTLVIFTTDHGVDFPRAKCSLYDPGIATALLMRWDGVLPKNRAVSELLSNIDLMPTILELAGCPVPESVQGVGFRGLLAGGAYQPRDCIMAEHTYHSAYNPMRCLRTHRYKFIRNFEPKPRNIDPNSYWQTCAGADYLRPVFAAPPPERELYDLAADPHEQNNLIGRYGYKETGEALEARLLAWMAETGDPLLLGPVEVPHGG
jgi:arylsulfatase A-like enzyme